MTPCRASVHVPASTSNLGAGFDCVGVAVDRWLTATATLRPGQTAVTIHRTGTLATLTVAVEDDFLARGFRAASDVAGARWIGGLTLDATSEIPIGCGLGSSAAALVAGALLADAVLGLGLPRERLVEIAAGIEGHPDNVAPAVYGGAALTVRAPGGGGLHVTPLTVSPEVVFLIAVPPFPSDTKAARAALPASVPFADAVLAASHAAALVQGLGTGDGVLLAAALDDVLHVPYRRAAIAGYDAVTAAARAAGAFGATLSGAGSSVLAIAPRAAADRVGAALLDAWRGAGVTAELLRVPRPAGGATVTDAPRTTQPAPLETT